MSFRRILVPIDFSEASLAALDAAKELAEALDGEISLLYAVELIIPADFANVGAAQLRRTHRREAAERLQQLERQVVEEGLRCRSRVVTGHPARAIVDGAEKLHADLIVMGTHGAGGFERLLLGSVTDRVMRAASCPVLTMRPGAGRRRRTRMRRRSGPTGETSAGRKRR